MVIIEAPQDPEHLVAPLPPLLAGHIKTLMICKLDFQSNLLHVYLNITNEDRSVW